MRMENSNLHLKIREERIKQGVSQKELGEMVGLPQQAINRIEQGQRKLDVELFEKLCKALNIKKIGNFTVHFISSYYEMDVGNDPLCLVDDLEDELPTNDSLSYNNSYSFASSEEEFDKYHEQQQKEEAAKNAPKFTAYDEKGNEIKAEKAPKFTTASRSHAQTEAYDLFHSLLSEDWIMTQEQETTAVQLKEMLGAYNRLNNAGRKEAVKRVDELTEIPRYTKPDEPPQE